MTAEERVVTRPGPPARIKDVAARAGVSLKTVTNVVHDRPHVRAETRARVRAAIEELDYRPSLAGRQLQSGRSNVIALAVPRIDEPYLGALAHALIGAAAPRGYTLLIDETAGDAEQEKLAATGYPGHGIDGVIFSPAALKPQEFRQTSHATPMVVLAEYLTNSTADYVAIDNVSSGRDVVKHLLAGGRRSMAFFGHQPARPRGVAGLRYQGYLEQTADAGLRVPVEWVIQGSRFSREEGEAAVGRVLAQIRSIDALICASDLLAIGAMRAFRRNGIRVPDDVAVVGWDNTIDGAYHLPSLTSVAPELSRLAELALDALVGRIDGNKGAGATYLVPHRLVVRESSRPG